MKCLLPYVYTWRGNYLPGCLISKNLLLIWTLIFAFPPWRLAKSCCGGLCVFFLWHKTVYFVRQFRGSASLDTDRKNIQVLDTYNTRIQHIDWAASTTNTMLYTTAISCENSQSCYTAQVPHASDFWRGLSCMILQLLVHVLRIHKASLTLSGLLNLVRRW